MSSPFRFCYFLVELYTYNILTQKHDKIIWKSSKMVFLRRFQMNLSKPPLIWHLFPSCLILNKRIFLMWKHEEMMCKNFYLMHYKWGTQERHLFWSSFPLVDLQQKIIFVVNIMTKLALGGLLNQYEKM